MTPQVEWEKATLVAKDVMALLLESYSDQKGVHAETVIGAAAALAGAYALRAATPLAPGNEYVLSAELDDLLFDGKTLGKPLTEIVLEFAQGAGVSQGHRPDPREINTRMISAFGSKTYPPLSVPRSHYPHEWSPNATVRLRPLVDALMASKGMNAVEAAAALTTAVAGLILVTANSLDPRISTTLALEIMVGVAHMRPLAREVGVKSLSRGSSPLN